MFTVLDILEAPVIDVVEIHSASSWSMLLYSMIQELINAPRRNLHLSMHHHNPHHLRSSHRHFGQTNMHHPRMHPHRHNQLRIWNWFRKPRPSIVASSKSTKTGLAYPKGRFQVVLHEPTPQSQPLKHDP